MATSSGAKPSTGKRSIFESSEFCAYTPLSSGATGGIQALGLIGTGQARKYVVSRTTTRIAARLMVCFMAGVEPQNSPLPQGEESRFTPNYAKIIKSLF